VTGLSEDGVPELREGVSRLTLPGSDGGLRPRRDWRRLGGRGPAAVGRDVSELTVHLLNEGLEVAPVDELAGGVVVPDLAQRGFLLLRPEVFLVEGWRSAAATS
jgi:hypothetical protein